MSPRGILADDLCRDRRTGSGDRSRPHTPVHVYAALNSPTPVMAVMSDRRPNVSLISPKGGIRAWQEGLPNARACVFTPSFVPFLWKETSYLSPFSAHGVTARHCTSHPPLKTRRNSDHIHRDNCTKHARRIGRVRIGLIVRADDDPPWMIMGKCSSWGLWGAGKQRYLPA